MKKSAVFLLFLIIAFLMPYVVISARVGEKVPDTEDVIAVTALTDGKLDLVYPRQS
ncbi:MAG: hypothetical protein GX059_07570 [Clostridiales bacterium]|nr:hypothetical protein [Clostridiales bacterium]